MKLNVSGILLSRKAKIALAFILISVLVFDLGMGKIAGSIGMPASEFYISTGQVILSKYRAKRGDADSIERLGWYQGIWKNNSEEQLHWWSVGANYGIPRYQFLYGKTQILMAKDKTSAITWIQKAASSGYEPALEFLEKEKRKGTDEGEKD